MGGNRMGILLIGVGIVAERYGKVTDRVVALGRKAVARIRSK